MPISQMKDNGAKQREIHKNYLMVGFRTIIHDMCERLLNQNLDHKNQDLESKEFFF